jgi:hypothetical protein
MVHCRKLKKKYLKLFKKNPVAANLFLLLFELAGPDGKIILPQEPEEIDRELTKLMLDRFQDTEGWQLSTAVI